MRTTCLAVTSTAVTTGAVVPLPDQSGASTAASATDAARGRRRSLSSTAAPRPGRHRQCHDLRPTSRVTLTSRHYSELRNVAYVTRHWLAASFCDAVNPRDQSGFMNSTWIWSSDADAEIDTPDEATHCRNADRYAINVDPLSRFWYVHATSTCAEYFASQRLSTVVASRSDVGACAPRDVVPVEGGTLRKAFSRYGNIWLATKETDAPGRVWETHDAMACNASWYTA